MGSGRRPARVLDALLARWRSFGDDAFEVGVAFAGLGELDEAFAWLERSLEDYSLGVESVETALEVIRGDPRWSRLRARVGLSPASPTS